jgi:hypothetical protein
MKTRSDAIIPRIQSEVLPLLRDTSLSCGKIGKMFNCSRGPIWNIQKIFGIQRPFDPGRRHFPRSCKWCGKDAIMITCKTRPNRGKFCSKECYTKWQESRENKGSKHPNWKPGIKREKLAHRSRKSKSWRVWRSKVYNRDNYICVLCGRTRCLVDPHHILPRRDFPKLKYIKSNGCTLCRECHQKTFGNEYKFIEILVNKIFGGLKQWKLIGHWMMLRKQRKIGYRAQ